MPKPIESGRYNLGDFIQKNQIMLGLAAAVLTTTACKASGLISRWEGLPLEVKMPLGLLAIATILGVTWWAGNVGNSIGDEINKVVNQSIPPSKPPNLAEKYMRQVGQDNWAPPPRAK